jgi:DNA polymerase III psi subunit
MTRCLYYALHPRRVHGDRINIDRALRLITIADPLIALRRTVIWKVLT